MYGEKERWNWELMVILLAFSILIGIGLNIK